MRKLSVKWIIMVASLVMMAGMTMAADYSWTGNGGDTNWTTPLNWQGGTGFPGASGDVATLSAADTVKLNTNGVLTAGRCSSPHQFQRPSR